MLDVITITVGKDPAQGAVIKLSIDGSTDVDLLFDLVTLQSVLVKIDGWHAGALSER